MDPKKLIVLAVVMGAAAVLLLQLQISKARGEAVTVFQATEARQPGETLDGVLRSTTLPLNVYTGVKSQVPTQELEGWVKSTPLVRPVAAGETITFDMLQRSADTGLKIKTGMRAVSIEVKGAQAVGYLVRPGDYVDVIATLPEGGGMLVTKHLLQAKKVLAVDQQYRPDDSAFVEAKQFSSVTLELAPAEVEIVEWSRAISQTGFALALRPKGDLKEVETPTVRANAKQLEGQS